MKIYLLVSRQETRDGINIHLKTEGGFSFIPCPAFTTYELAENYSRDHNLGATILSVEVRCI